MPTANDSQLHFELLLPHDEWLTPAQFAASVGRGESWARDLIESGQLAAFASAGRRARQGERRTRGRGNNSYLIHRRDALVWLANAYTGEPEDIERRLADIFDRLPRATLVRLQPRLNTAIQAARR